MSFESCGENNKAPRFFLRALNPAERTAKPQGFTSEL
jgi:hypothetical protein